MPSGTLGAMTRMHGGSGKPLRVRKMPGSTCLPCAGEPPLTIASEGQAAVRCGNIMPAQTAGALLLPKDVPTRVALQRG